MINVQVKQLGVTDFAETCHQMQQFTAQRTHESADELWVTEHLPVYSLGLNRKGVASPLRDDIPVIECDRGGKITYHGPGQLIIYGLMDLSRYGFTIRDWVSALEQSVVSLLADCQVKAEARSDAPGVYVSGAKVASLGLRMKKQFCYHGISLNVDMDLTPFQSIDPCGYANLPITQLKDLHIPLSQQEAAEQLVSRLQADYLHPALKASHGKLPR